MENLQLYELTVLQKQMNLTLLLWYRQLLPTNFFQLQAAKIPFLPTAECIKPNVYGPNKLTSGMVCAGYLSGGVDTCQGDSGGPLVCQVSDDGRRHALMGLTSWGYGCGRANRPGVYTKVVEYLDWIVERMTNEVR